MRISDWSSDVCSSDLLWRPPRRRRGGLPCREDSAGPYRGGVQALQVWREPQRSHSEEYRDRRDYGAEGLLQTRPRYAGRQGRELQLLVFGLTLDSRRQPWLDQRRDVGSGRSLSRALPAGREMARRDPAARDRIRLRHATGWPPARALRGDAGVGLGNAPQVRPDRGPAAPRKLP